MHKKLITLSLICLIGTAMFFLETNPSNLPVGFLMVPILLAFGVCSLIAMLYMRSFNLLDKQPRKQRSIAILFGILGALFLVFKSTGGLVAGDIVLIALIFVVTYIYITRY